MSVAAVPAVGAPARATARPAAVCPGSACRWACTVTYLSLLVLIPLAGLVWQHGVGWTPPRSTRAVISPRALAAYRLSFGARAVAGGINVVFGLLVAWVLVRYAFPGGPSSTRSWTCRSRCRRRWPASR